MIRNQHDQFAKDLLVALLEPLGHVTRQVELSPETLYVDVRFEGLAPGLTPDEIASLGLLGRLVPGPCLLEPYRTPLRDSYLTSAILKLGWFHRQVPPPGMSPPSPAVTPPTRMWVLVPTATPARLQRFGLVEASRPGHTPPPGVPVSKGAYTLPPAWGLGLVVLNTLPPTLDTLFLRLLGTGRTQLLAARQLAELPLDDPRRRTHLDLILKWRIFSDQNTSPSHPRQEVFMFLRTAGTALLEQKHAEGVNAGWAKGLEKGIEKGIELGTKSARRAISRAWSSRFGEVPPSLEMYLAQVSSLEVLEEILDEVLTADDPNVCLEWVLPRE